MITSDATQLQASLEKGVVLDSAAQRVFRLRKGILTASRLIHKRLEKSIDAKGRKRRWVPVMVTLTYRAEVEWQPEHITKYVNRVQMYAKRKGGKLPYCWVMELTKKGKPHYHCIFWIPVGWLLPKSDVRGWWEHGDTNTCRAHNPYGYLAKYASKCQGPKSTEGGYLHDFPKGARIHGIGGLTDYEAAVVAWWKLPKALRRGEEGSHKWRRQDGGGWRCIEGDAAGEYYDSGWGLSAINTEKKRVRLVEKKGTPERVSDGWALIEADRDVRWRKGADLLAGVALQLEKYRASWVWQGAARGFEHPDDLPSLELSAPINPLGPFRFVPLPF